MDLSSALEKQQKAFADGENAGGGRGSGSGKSETDRQVERLQDVMQALDDERAMITMNRTEQRALQAQRRANVDATSDEGMAIAALIGKIDEERKSYEAAEKASTFMRDAARDSFMDLLPAIDTGNKALDGFINKMAEAAAEAAFFGTGPFAGVFGTASGGSLLGDLFSFKGFRAEGGSVDPWGSYVVGEKGPEVLRMGGAGGHVTSNKDAFGGGSGVFNIDARTTVQASGNAEADADMRRWAVKRDAELPGRIIRVIKDAQMRRLL